MTKVLVIGSGGREHALAWKLGQSPHVETVFVAPGNAGTAMDAVNVNISADDIGELVRFAKDNQIGMTVVGPEAPLCAGIVDAFQIQGLRIFGPTQKAAQLEGSKVFCKEMLRKANVPTADFRVFDDAARALEYLESRYGETPEDVPVVVKADGLAAGKGAIVCHTMDEASKAVDRILGQREFGDAGQRLIIEDRLPGEEASVLAITDGRSLVTLPPAQDHKRAGDNDTGPNTGGMGAYCPAPVVNQDTMEWVESNVLIPTMHAMKKSGAPFCGILYAGLMLSQSRPHVLEYNVRFGDPECQPLLMRLKSDLFEVFDAAIDGRLGKLAPLEWDPRPSVCVVMASEGYPGSYEKGHPIRGLDEAAQIENVKVFHAGTVQRDDGLVVTNGGRVLGVTALGDTVAQAKANAYRAVRCIRWPGAWCRKDIADRAIRVPSTSGG